MTVWVKKKEYLREIRDGSVQILRKMDMERVRAVMCHFWHRASLAPFNADGILALRYTSSIELRFRHSHGCSGSRQTVPTRIRMRALTPKPSIHADMRPLQITNFGPHSPNPKSHQPESPIRVRSRDQHALEQFQHASDLALALALAQTSQSAPDDAAAQDHSM